MFLQQGLYCKETQIVKETINLITQSLAFQNKHFNSVHFILHVKLTCKNQVFKSYSVEIHFFSKICDKWLSLLQGHRVSVAKKNKKTLIKIYCHKVRISME